MISHIHSTSPYLTISGGTSSTYVNGYSGAQGVGNMRYNTSMQKTEVFDGANWITLNMGAVSIGLSPDIEFLINWARKKKDEEMLLEKQAQEHPTIKSLVDEIKQKQEQIKMVQTLLSSPGHDEIKPSMVP